MAIEYDGWTMNTEASGGGGRSSFSFAHGGTGASGRTRTLLVFAAMRSNSSSPSISSLTAGGTAMTKLTGASVVNEYSAGNWINLETWYLQEPADGYVTIAGSYNITLPLADAVMSVMLLNVDPRSPFGQSDTNGAVGTNPNVAFTSLVGAGSVVIFYSGKLRGASSNADWTGSNLTQATEGESGTGTAGDLAYAGGTSGALAAGPANVTYGVTYTPSNGWTAAAVQLRLMELGIPPLRRRRQYVRF